MDAFNSLECTGSCSTAGAGDRERFHCTRLREHSQNPGSEEGTQHHTFGFHTDAIWKSRVLFAALTRRRAQRICSRETLNKHTSHPVENGGWTSSAVPRGLWRLAVNTAKIRGDKAKHFAGYSVLFRQTTGFHAWKDTAS